MRRLAFIAAILMLGGCTAASPHIAGNAPPPDGCATASAAIRFDIPSAPETRCTILGDREFALLVTPEHAPPINPSPWYAFRYSASGSDGARVRLDYLGAKHRYAPKLTRDGQTSDVPVSVAKDGQSASFVLPPGSGVISAQPILASRHYGEFVRELVSDFGARKIDLGRSLDGRPIDAVRLGDASAPRIIVILGRQHPPEVTGSYALEPFVRSLARRFDDPELGRTYQVLVVPELNPDGVERGHWRANRGGVDLNRDWAAFSQPETRAVRDWLASNSDRTRPVAMIDFHSTWRNLFYVQGSEAGAAHQRFLQSWLGGKEKRFAGYEFTIEPRNANPGSGTAKNWFFGCFGIPSYTYEVSDDADRAATAAAAATLASEFVDSLSVLAGGPAEEPEQDCGIAR